MRDVVHRPGSAAFAISIRRAKEYGPFSPDELHDLAPLARHAARAFEIATRLADAAIRSNAVTEALTQLGYGVIGLGGTGRVLFTNTLVDALERDGLRVVNGAVIAAKAQDQPALDGLISQTLSLAAGTTPAPPQPIALRRPSGRLPAVLYGIPVAEKHTDLLTLLGGRPKALLVVIEPDAARHMDQQLLRQMFGLSPGEARLAAAIGTGVSAKDAAVRFGISEATVRVVLKQVFQKLGVSRQAELVLLLAPLLRRS